jgi:hypothetical protein
MKRKKDSLLERDSTLRLIFAFNYFCDKTDNWETESEVSMKNREIVESMSMDTIVDADHYFIYQQRFYSFSSEKKEDGTIECRVEECNNFYDLAGQSLSMSFNYNPLTKTIDRLDEISVKTKKNDKEAQKILSAA